MADMANGFGLSIKNGNDMFTVQGVDYETFKSNLQAWLDDGEAPPMLGNFDKTDGGALSNIAATFGDVTPAIAPEPTVPQDSGTVNYEVCGQPTSSGPCGSLKNQWKEGGSRPNGTTYKGFWGCSDWQNHLKKR